MKITGYKLQAAIKRAKQSREIQNHLFNENLFQFDDDKVVDPGEAWEAWRKEERRLVKLQVLKEKYNNTVTVKVMGEELPLSEAVKQQGVASRAERVWRQAAKGSTYQTRGQRRYGLGGSGRVREEGNVYAKPAFTVAFCQEKSKQYGVVLGALKEAIQHGNSVEIEFEEATEDLFE